ncbi:MAG TPA: hypothetical protein VK196_12585 [Magnetospirillum sp.]|nr:hypothetical protein [Magnetospirillum sp.]
MIRLLSAAALAVLLAAPAMAQSVSPSERSDPSLQNQGSSSVPGSSGQTQTNPNLSGQTPIDCLPNDPRPACQTAQLPGQEPGSSSSVSPSTPAEREGSSGMGGSGSMGSQPSGSSGSMGR